MKTKIIFSVLIITALSFISFRFSSYQNKIHLLKAPSIEGTYKLLWRKLSDGTIIKPPFISGIQSYTKGERNLNIMWIDSNGKHISVSIYSDYKLTGKDYTETIHFGIMNDEINGKGITYITDQTKTVPIKINLSRIKFKLPFDPPILTFDGNKMTAEEEGIFTDTWEKLK